MSILPASEISVIITCYNEENLIAEAIDSVLKQTALHEIKEIIVVNDGSTDSSEKVILQLASANSKLKYYHQQNQGLPSARNTGIRNASGNYIAFLDGDDLWTENKIENVLTYIRQFPDVGLFYSNFYSYRNDTKKLTPVKINKFQRDQPELLKNFLLKGGPIVPSTAVVKMDCFTSVGLFDPVFRLAQDTDMWLRIATRYNFQHINEILVWKREMKKSLGSNTVEKAKYFKMAFDKIERQVPGLEPYRKQRDISIEYKVALYHYGKGEWSKARSAITGALQKNKKLLKGYFLYLAIWVKQLLKIDILKLAKKEL